MADTVFNVAKGRVNELVERVEQGDPTNARIVWVVINTTETDANLADLDTLALVLGNANTAEVTNTNYSRTTHAAANVSRTVDDTNNNQRSDADDLAFTSVGAGDAWTDVLGVYFPDGVTPGADSTGIPLVMLDAVATPNGGNITLQFNADGFFSAA